MVLVDFSSLSSGRSMAIFAMMAFEMLDDCVVAGKWEWELEVFQ
jgi:hypothetical protein